MKNIGRMSSCGVCHLPLLFVFVLALGTHLGAQTTLRQSLFDPDYEPSFSQLRDTLFVLDSTYLEVRLDQQMIYRHYRSGRIEKYPCSTGDPRIEDGIATREGIFTVQWKSRKHMSQQFGVYLNYWMPFDGGIGFHGLQGRSYYRHLGKKQSSHGCVRISNETGARLFPGTTSGTVVYVHSGSPARILRFGDSAATMQVTLREDRTLLKARLADVLANRWDAPTLATKLAIPSRARLTERIDVGRVDARRITQHPIPLLKAEGLSAILSDTRPMAPVLRPVRLQSPEQSQPF